MHWQGSILPWEINIYCTQGEHKNTPSFQGLVTSKLTVKCLWYLAILYTLTSLGGDYFFSEMVYHSTSFMLSTNFSTSSSQTDGFAILDKMLEKKFCKWLFFPTMFMTLFVGVTWRIEFMYIHYLQHWMMSSNAPLNQFAWSCRICCREFELCKITKLIFAGHASSACDINQWYHMKLDEIM